MPTLLIVTPTLGTSPYLEDTIRSVSDLVSGELRVKHLVVGPARVSDLVVSKRSKAELAFVKEPGPHGMYAAINHAISHESPDWDFLSYINDDDFLLPGYRELVSRLKENPSLGIAYGEVPMISKSGEVLAHLPICHRPKDLLSLIRAGIMPIAQPGLLISREGWQQCGPFDASFTMAADLDFIIRALLRGVTFSYASERVACFRVWGQQLSKNEHQGENERLKACSLIPSGTVPAMVKLRFWHDNWRNYLHRIMHHGLKSSRQLYRYV